MFFLKEDTAVDIKLGPFVDKGDGVAYETGMAAAMDHATTGVRLSKNGGAFADRNEGTEPSYDAFGYYLVKLDTTDTNTPGRLKVIFGDAAVCLPCEANFQVVHANVFDSLLAAAATDYLQVDQLQLGGATQSATDLKDFADTGYDPSTHKAQSDLIYIHGSALTETAGQLAAAFVKLFDVATPLLVASDVMRGSDVVPRTAQQIRDAMKLDCVGNAPAAGSIDKHLDDIVGDTNELQGNQGAWATATGFSTHNAAAVKTAMEAAGSDLERLMIALVNKMIITEANGNTEQFDDADSTLGSIAAAFETDGTYTSRKKLVI